MMAGNPNPASRRKHKTRIRFKRFGVRPGNWRAAGRAGQALLSQWHRKVGERGLCADHRNHRGQDHQVSVRSGRLSAASAWRPAQAAPARRQGGSGRAVRQQPARYAGQRAPEPRRPPLLGRLRQRPPPGPLQFPGNAPRPASRQGIPGQGWLASANLLAQLFCDRHSFGSVCRP